MKKLTSLFLALMASFTMMQGATIDIAALTNHYIAQDGDTLTGALTRYLKISVADGATVTLHNVDITYGINNPDYPWAGLNCLGDVTVNLSGTNALNGFYENWPGLHVVPGKTVTIQGEGSLTASSRGYASGIGGGYTSNTSCGNIVIAGGIIEAYGGVDTPGIGSGLHGTCGDITITGGTVTAIGNRYAAGIGTGYGGTCGNITIGADITRVTAVHGNSASDAIGAAANGSCGTITIAPSLNDVTEGNTRTLTPYEEPSHIIDIATLTDEYTLQDGDTLTGTAKIYFSINIADGATVTFSDLNVTYGSKWKCFNCLGSATINIADDTQNTLANSEDYYQSAAVITNGPSGSTLTINGTTGRLTINAGRYAPAIGGNNAGARGHIVINGGVIVANAGGDAPGIGCRDHTYMGDITINGGNITAYGSNYHYGIGANDYASCGTITINGGTITASGGERGGGIGGQCAGIVINDGIITASCRSMGGPGIGGSGDLTINGGDITAVGGNFAAGIGSGYEGSCGAITIGGSITRVIATHGDYTTVAIGAGVDGTCGTITIASNLNDVTEGNTRTLTPSSTPTAIENTAISEKAIKRIVNGQFLILRGEKTYTVTGQEVK